MDKQKNQNIIGVVFAMIAIGVLIIMFLPKKLTAAEAERKAIKLLGEHRKTMQTLSKVGQMVNVNFFMSKLQPLYEKLGYQIAWNGTELYLIPLTKTN